MSIDEIMAHHEAVHAVAALALGVPLIEVTLSEARIRPLAFDLSDPYDIERDAIFTLAGEKAEGYVHEDIGHTSEADRKHFEELCIDRYPDDQERRASWMLEMHRKTDAVVEQHWSSIELLAAHVLERRALSKAEVVQHLKYRLAFVVDGMCVLRYDNEAGKGDHRHVGAVESPYTFTTPEQLYADFMADVTNWRT